MNSAEIWIRVGFFVWAATLTPVGFVFRLRSQTDEVLDRTQEGWTLLLGIRLTALASLVLIAAWLFAPHRLPWAEIPLPLLVRWIGFAIAMISLLLKTWTFASIGKNITDTVVTRRDHELVRHGPYRYVRHPFYSSFMLDVVGIGLMTAWWPLLLGLMAVLVMLILRTKREEVFLIEAFGDEYRRYRREVGAFVPRMSSRR